MHTKDNHIFIRLHALPGERFVIHILSLAIIMSVLGYSYFVSVSIRNVIVHKEAVAESDRLQSEVGLLEQEYFELSKKVTPELATSLGMSPTSDTEFVRRPGAVGSVQGARGL
ncbi:MAG: hypothetical protein WAZ27_02995 [Minisyncoccia bacterium]